MTPEEAKNKIRDFCQDNLDPILTYVIIVAAPDQPGAVAHNHGEENTMFVKKLLEVVASRM